MYARYNYSSAATQQQILADVISILTGTTSTASLSSGTDTVNSFILTTYNLAGWTLHDSTAKSLGTVTFSNVGGNLTMNKGTTVGLSAGVPFTLTGGTAPTGLVLNTVVYVSTVGLTTTACTFADTLAHALAGTNTITYTDAGAGTKTGWCGLMQILKAPSYDLPATYIYQMLDVITTAAQITTNLYEAWDASTHIGTNLTNGPAYTNMGARFTVGAAASMIISASANYSMIQSNTAAGLNGAAGNGGGFTIIAQHTRLTPWDTVANAYPNSVYFKSCSTSGSVGIPRIKNPVGGDKLTTTITPTIGYGVYGGKIPDGIGGSYYPLGELSINAPYAADLYLGGSISQICDIWNGLSYPQNLDEVQANGKIYIHLTADVGLSAANICVPKG
jgi:hypothetical protein